MKKNITHLSCKTKYRYLKAFSLIELLISLIIISLITASFAPVITKGISKQSGISGAIGGQNCKKFDSENKCIMCSKDECIFCSTQLNLSLGQYVNPSESCEIKTCPKGCLKCDGLNCSSCLNGFEFNSETKKCNKCPDGFYCEDGNKKQCPQNCVTCTSDLKCVECEEKYTLSDGECIKDDGDCYIAGYSKICIAKYNAGDPNGLDIPDGLVTKIPTSSYALDKNHNYGLAQEDVCWVGENTAYCGDSPATPYSGCARTVCTFQAAKKICDFHGWRLPTKAELSSFYSYSLGKGEEGIQMCRGGNVKVEPQCFGALKCQGAVSNLCCPFQVWSGERYNDVLSLSYCYNLGQSSADGITNCYWNQAVSVRCVRDL